MISVAMHEDVPQIVSMCYASFYENQMEETGILPDFDKTCIHIEDYVNKQMVIVDREEHLINAILILDFDVSWWSLQPIISTAMFYIKPEKRTYKLAVNLLKAAKECAIINKVPLLLDLFAQKDVRRKERLLERQGFKKYGSLFIFNSLGTKGLGE